jgi:hypothetical protein
MKIDLSIRRGGLPCLRAVALRRASVVTFLRSPRGAPLHFFGLKILSSKQIGRKFLERLKETVWSVSFHVIGPGLNRITSEKKSTALN